MFFKYQFWLVCGLLSIALTVSAFNVSGQESDSTWVVNGHSMEYRLGDQSGWAQETADNEGWLPLEEANLIDYQGIYWVRFQLDVSGSEHAASPIRVIYRSLMAFDMFWDGHLLMRNGQPGNTVIEEVPGLRQGFTILPMHLFTDGKHIVSLRVSSHHWQHRHSLYADQNVLFQYIKLVDYLEDEFQNRIDRQLASGFMAVNLFVACYYFLLFFVNREKKSHLLLGLVCFFVFMLGLSENLNWIIDLPYSWDFPRHLVIVTSVVALCNLLPLAFLTQFDTQKIPIWFAVLWVYFILCLLLAYDKYLLAWIFSGSILLSIVVLLNAIRRKQRLAWLPLVGLLICLVGLRLEENYLYISFTVFCLTMLAGLTMQDRHEREQFHFSRLQASKLEAELLRRNLQPHFLMNSLTTVQEWVETEPDKAAVFIDLLADEFRMINRASKQTMISLEEELKLCRLHLEIMSYRLQCHFSLVTENVVNNTEVPPAILHTLIENSISHNQYSAAEITFRLVQHSHQHHSCLTLYTPLPTRKKRRNSALSTGTGTQYIESRLQQCFADQWRFTSREQGDVWCNEIQMPRRAPL